MHSTLLDWNFLSPTVYLGKPQRTVQTSTPKPSLQLQLGTPCFLPQSLYHLIDSLPSVSVLSPSAGHGVRGNTKITGTGGKSAQNSPKHVWAQSLRWHP